MCREKRFGGIKAARDDIAAHTLEHGVADAIADWASLSVAGAEPFFGENELVREPPRLVIGIVVLILQPDPYGFATGVFLEKSSCRMDQFFGPTALIGKTQKFNRCFSLLLGPFALSDIHDYTEQAIGRIVIVIKKNCLSLNPMHAPLGPDNPILHLKRLVLPHATK